MVRHNFVLYDLPLSRHSSSHLTLFKHCICQLCTVKPLLRGHPDERPPPLGRPLDNVNLNINVLISTPGERPPLLKGHFSDAKEAASQEGFHCNICHSKHLFKE